MTKQIYIAAILILGFYSCKITKENTPQPEEEKVEEEIIKTPSHSYSVFNSDTLTYLELAKVDMSETIKLLFAPSSNIITYTADAKTLQFDLDEKLRVINFSRSYSTTQKDSILYTLDYFTADSVRLAGHYFHINSDEIVTFSDTVLKYPNSTLKKLELQDSLDLVANSIMDFKTITTGIFQDSVTAQIDSAHVELTEAMINVKDIEPKSINQPDLSTTITAVSFPLLHLSKPTFLRSITSPYGDHNAELFNVKVHLSKMGNEDIKRLDIKYTFKAAQNNYCFSSDVFYYQKNQLREYVFDEQKKESRFSYDTWYNWIDYGCNGVDVEEVVTAYMTDGSKSNSVRITFRSTL